MLAMVIAAACLWRGLTDDEATAVGVEVMARLDALDAQGQSLDTLTTAAARRLLDDAIADVVAVSRP